MVLGGVMCWNYFLVRSLVVTVRLPDCACTETKTKPYTHQLYHCT